MRKCKLIPLLALIMPMIVLSGFTFVNRAGANEETEGHEAKIILLSPYIENAINQHYGDQVVFDYMGQPTARQVALYAAQIDGIRKVTERPGNGYEYFYMITVAVPTFHGAHNDPHALEVLTFIVKPNIEPQVVDYRHIPNATIDVHGNRKCLRV